MEENNNLSLAQSISGAYKNITVNPLVHSLGLAAIGVPLAYLFKRPLNKMLRAVGQDPRVNTLNGTRTKQTQENLDQLQRDPVYKHGIPWAVGMAPALLALGMNIRPNSPYYGLLSWNDQKYLNKKSFLITPNQQTKRQVAQLWNDYGYQPSVDFGMPINTGSTIDMLRSNPFLKESPYERALGVSIISGARQTGNSTTLGAVYDSAVDKFDTKLNFQGVANKAVKSTVKGALAGMFTDVIGSIVGLPNPLRGQLANTAGFATAITSILK